MTNADNETTTTAYNSVSELTSVSDPLSQVSSFTYELGRPDRSTDEIGRYVENAYDLAGRLVTVERFAPDDSLLTTSSFAYDEVGNRTSATSPRGNETGVTAADFTTTWTFDALSRLVQVDQPVSSTATLTTTYGYDAGGNPTRVTNPDGVSWVMSYNPWGLQEDYIEPVTTAFPLIADRTFTTSYDAGGLPVHEVMPGGVTMSRTFDELGRVSDVTGAGAATPTKSFGYDLAGFQTEVSHPSGTIGFVYDDRGLLDSVSGPAGTATYDYDPVGRLTQRVDAAGTHNFTWTDRGELDTATDGVSGLVADYVWSDASQVQTVTYGTGGPVRAYTYDDHGRLTLDRLEDGAQVLVTETAYDYDVDANLTVQNVTLSANAEDGASSFTYDNSGRLDTWTHDSNTTQYSWDGAGNRLTAGADTYTYDERNQILTGPEGDFTYTARGTTATVSDGTTTVAYTFDAFGRLTDYDGTVTYTYDGLDRVATRDGVTFTYAGFSLDPTSDGTFSFAHSPGGRVLAVDDGTDAFLAGQNRHGDLTHLFTAAGVISDTTLYDPFGDVTATSGTVDPTIGYQSDYTDPDSEHVWMGARWYDSGRAAFLSRDTIFGELSTPISLNRYTYAANNPLAFWDPDGRLFEQVAVDGLCANAASCAGDVVGGAGETTRGTNGATVASLTARRLLNGLDLLAADQDLPARSGNGAETATEESARVASDDQRTKLVRFGNSVFVLPAGFHNLSQDQQLAVLAGFAQRSDMPLGPGRFDPAAVLWDVYRGMRNFEAAATDLTIDSINGLAEVSELLIPGARLVSQLGIDLTPDIPNVGPFLTGLPGDQESFNAAYKTLFVGELLVGGKGLVDNFDDVARFIRKLLNNSDEFAPNGLGGLADDPASVPFRSDTSHIFRDSAGHLLDDTAANRTLIQSAIDPTNLRTSITLPDGSSLSTYFRTLPDGTQVWAEVRNGLEITNGGLNAIPR